MFAKYLILFLLVGVVSAQDWGGGKRSRDACPRPSLRNGKFKPRSNGRVVKYSCNRDFVLVGESTATCLLGEWTSEPPVCATRGCPPLNPPPSGRFIYSYGGAVIRLECNPGYAPAGPPMLYCVDRFDWNGTAPICRASSMRQSALTCDFETDDLCGWIQDTSADEFDWTWHQRSTPSSQLGTGPSYDHTLGEGKEGHYLFIESSSPRMLNDTARLFSPVYAPPEARLACFTFWYHMYGSTTGRLNVYIKPESSKWSQLKPLFVRSGDQGNQWRQGYVPLENITENFQVVIEGVRGTGYVGDSAIDDVAIATGAECQIALARSTADMSNPASGKQGGNPVPAMASCSSRCSPTGAKQEAGGKEEWACDCRDDCLLKNSCCADYATYCLAGGNATIPGEPTNTETTTPAATPASSTVSSSLAPTTSATISSTMTTSSSSATSSTSTTSSTPSTTTTILPTTTTTTPRPTTTTTTPTTTTSTTTTPKTTTSTTRATTTSTEQTTSTTTTTPIPTTTTKSSTTTTTRPTTTTTTAKPTTTTRPTTTTLQTIPTTAIWMTTTEAIEVPQPTTTVISTNGLQGDDSMDWPAARDETKSAGFPTVGGAIIASGVLVVTGAALFAFIRNRRIASTGGRRPGASLQSQLAEDSDVRYLRDDDDIQLDLTEATPGPAPSQAPAKTQSASQLFADFERF